ncbi:Mitochondrial import inner membrane translocase subunit tim21 [Erysiphe necator]|uniref:Mitochondrial import inner membrane translocase subunit Tim21 n=1 Tax=Uncinula necator TaxID=52586 RepID=A0A0B1PGN1_UNCNE|nr:Mitochondrial import inner membrane translocase subunit tim21 [Erysiphe necator]KHJ36016.1 putative import inner membrane translocase subunit tim-21 [Erysiphe necator]
MQFFKRYLFPPNFRADYRQYLKMRHFATNNKIGSSNSKPKDNHLTSLNINEIAPWNKLSGKGKVLRATRQTFNVGLIVSGAALSGGVAYLLYSEVFSPDSKTSHFNRSFNQIKKDPRCIALLGNVDTITAYGENGGSWRKSRPFLSINQKDKDGVNHLFIKYNVQGSKSSGTVDLHMTKRDNENEFKYKRLQLDVKGKPRIVLIDADSKPVSKSRRLKVFGVYWN